MQSTSLSNLNLNGFLPRGARRSPEPESPSPRVPPTTSSFPQCQCFSRGFRCRPGARSVLSVDSSRSVVLRVGQDRQTQKDGNRRRLFHDRFPRAHFHIAHRTRTVISTLFITRVGRQLPTHGPLAQRARMCSKKKEGPGLGGHRHRHEVEVTIR